MIVSCNILCDFCIQDFCIHSRNVELMATEPRNSTRYLHSSPLLVETHTDLKDIIGSSDETPDCKNDNAHFFCGAGSSAINIVLTFPVNKVMFRQQLFGFRVQKAIQQMRHEGIIRLYRGLPAPLLQKSLSMSLMFGLYHKGHHVMRYEWRWNNTVATLIASVFAGTCEAILTPFERVQVLLLTPKHHGTFKSTYHTLTTLHCYNSGVKEYYRGLSAILIRNGFSNAIFFGLRKPIKQLLPKADQGTVKNSVNDFISGAVIGAICSTLFYPINVIKTRMQSNVGGEFLSLKQTYVLIYNERGRDLRKFFRGCHVNIARSFLSWGIINASFEMLLKFFYDDKSWLLCDSMLDIVRSLRKMSGRVLTWYELMLCWSSTALTKIEVTSVNSILAAVIFLRKPL